MPRLPTTPVTTDEAMTTTLLKAAVPAGVEEGVWGTVLVGSGMSVVSVIPQRFKEILSSGFTGSRSS